MERKPIIREEELEINKEEAKVLDKARELLKEMYHEVNVKYIDTPIEKKQAEIINRAYESFDELCARFSTDTKLGK